MTLNRVHQLAQHRAHRRQWSRPKQHSRRQAPNSPRSPHLPLGDDGDSRIPRIHPVMILPVLLTPPPARRKWCCHGRRHPVLHW